MDVTSTADIVKVLFDEQGNVLEDSHLYLNDAENHWMGCESGFCTG